MRGVMKGAVALMLISSLLALFQACALDNGILKPSCLIFEIDLVERMWLPEGDAQANYSGIFFNSNGEIYMQNDTLNFYLENCNKIIVTDGAKLHQEQWVIKVLTDSKLQLQYPDTVITYFRKKK